MPPRIKTDALQALPRLHQEYLDEYESIADKFMENVPTHDFFDNWLIATHHGNYARLLHNLEESGFHIRTTRCDSILIDEDGKSVSIVN